MTVYEALLRDGQEKRQRATEQALFQAQEAAKTLAQREQKLLANLAALLPGTYYMDPPDGGSVTLLEQLERMAKDAERYRRSLRDRPTSEPGGCECSRCGCIFIGGPVHDVCGVCKAAQDGTGPDYVAPVTECEACLTEDACRIRGQCAHYLREREHARRAIEGLHWMPRVDNRWDETDVAHAEGFNKAKAEALAALGPNARLSG